MKDIQKLVDCIRLNEAYTPPSLGSYIQNSEDAIRGIRPSSKADQRRIEIALDNIKNVARQVRRMEAQLSELKDGENSEKK